MRTLVIYLIFISISQSSFGYQLPVMSKGELRGVKESVFSSNINFDKSKGTKYTVNGDPFMFEAFFFTKAKKYEDDIYFRDVYRVMKFKQEKTDIYYQHEVTSYLTVYLASDGYSLDSQEAINVTKGIDLNHVKLIDSIITSIPDEYNYELIGNWRFLRKNENLKLKLKQVDIKKGNTYTVYVKVMKGDRTESTRELLIDIEKRNVVMAGIVVE